MASTAAIVTIGSASWRSVARYMPATRPGGTRSAAAAASTARKQAVPAALSQLNRNTAA
ncbi:hypothetical protein D3C83_92370 [compost metagenome]